MAGLAVAEMFQRAARERQVATLKQGSVMPVTQKIEERESNRSNNEAMSQAAEVVGTNRQYMYDAAKIQREANRRA
jgi:hypothetical protein